MGTVITNLKARFGADTSDLKKGMKDGAKAVDDFKDAAGNSVEKLADLFGVNMGAVNGTLTTVQKSLNFVGSAFRAGAEGGNKFALVMKVVKMALISSGIGALVVALGSLAAYFTKSGEGADKLAVALAKIRSVIDNVIDRAAVLGKGLLQIVTGKFKEGWETMRGAIKGLGDEIKEDWKAAGDLARREDELYDKETALITSLEERRRKVAELRLQAKEEKEDAAKAMTLLGQAMEIEKSMTADQVSIEKERLAIMKEKLALAAKDPTDEQLREIAEQQARVDSVLAEGADSLRAMQREYGTLKKTAEDAAAAQIKAAQEVEKAWQNMVTNAKPATLQVFDMSKIDKGLKRVEGAVVNSMSRIDTQINSVLEESFETMLSGLGEFLGGLATGEGGINAFGKVVAGTFADMAITVGKIAIATGISIKGIKAALESLNPAVAIAAGVALVALGSMVKGALANAASGSSIGSSGGLTAGGSATFDLRNVAIKQQTVVIRGEVKVVQSGRDLRGVLNIEDNIQQTNT